MKKRINKQKKEQITQYQHITCRPPHWGFRKAQIETHFNKKWTDYWDNVIDHKHSKRFIDGPDKNKAKGILRLSRSILTLLIRAITNHNFLGSHKKKVDPNISTCCRFCEEDKETFMHLLTDCPALRQT